MAQGSDYCGKLQGFKEVVVSNMKPYTILLGLTARKAELADKCKGGVQFQDEQSPRKTLLRACERQNKKGEFRLLYNTTQFCFDKFRRRSLRQVFLDISIGVDNNSFPFVQFVDEFKQFGPDTTIANSITLRREPINSTDFCNRLSEPYSAGKVQQVVDLLSLGTTLYKVSLQSFCPSGIYLQYALSPARMLQYVCKFQANTDEYWLRFESEGFCIVYGSFLSGFGYNRKDVYDVLVRRTPPSAYWINFESSSFSLQQPEAAGLSPISARVLPRLPKAVIIPNAVAKLLSPSPDTSPPLSPAVPSTPLTDQQILQRIIDGEDARQSSVLNTVIVEIADKSMQSKDPDLLDLAFDASTVVNGNLETIFQQIAASVILSDNIETVIEVIDKGIMNGRTESMAEGIVSTLSAGTEWMQLIDEAITQNSCVPIVQLLNSVRQLSLEGDVDVEFEFVRGVGIYNASMLPCLTNCEYLDGFVTGGRFTVEDQTNVNIGYNTRYSDLLIQNNECPGQNPEDPNSIPNDPSFQYSPTAANQINVKCVNETNSSERTYFVQVDVQCWNAENILTKEITVLEISAKGRVQPQAVPISIYSLVQSQ